MEKFIITILSILILILFAVIIDCSMGTRHGPFTAQIYEKDYQEAYTSFETTYHSDGKGNSYPITTPVYHPPVWSVEMLSSNQSFHADIKQGLYDSITNGERVISSSRVGWISHANYFVSVQKANETETP